MAHPRLKIQQHRPRDVVLIVSLQHGGSVVIEEGAAQEAVRGQHRAPHRVRADLVEEDILSVVALCGKLLQDALGVDAMLCTQLLPELHANCVCRTDRGEWR